MKLEAVIVCVNYADFLSWSILFNKYLFDNIVVVSDTKDIATHRVCEQYHIKCIKTDECHEDGMFNKGKMINVGLSHLTYNDWVVHIDADICLPPHFRTFINNLKLDPDNLYSVDRLMCKSFKEWVRYLSEPSPQFENCIFIHPRPFEMGVRLGNNGYGGWLPIGYFQMWNQGLHRFTYPTEHTGAARTDVQFTLKFDRDKRVLIPEIFAIHLETKLPENDNMGANWNGRTTPKFTDEFFNDSTNCQ
jgi:hypothetical protein